MTQEKTRSVAPAVAASGSTRTSSPPRSRRGKVGQETTNWAVMVILFLCALTVLLPLYVTISMSMKSSAQSVDGNALSL
ncbi:MAG: carbohydrate ABC transporter permease, partial [Mycetocola sp.]